MGPYICSRHNGYSWLVGTAPAIAAAVNGLAAESSPLVRLDILGSDGAADAAVWLDRSFAQTHGLSVEAQALVRLQDRSKAGRDLHDRLTINRLRRDYALVCLHCLELYLVSRGYPMALRRVRPLSRSHRHTLDQGRAR